MSTNKNLVPLSLRAAALAMAFGSAQAQRLQCMTAGVGLRRGEGQDQMHRGGIIRVMAADK